MLVREQLNLVRASSASQTDGLLEYGLSNPAAAQPIGDNNVLDDCPMAHRRA
jgi:hypothetical protein